MASNHSGCGEPCLPAALGAKPAERSVAQPVPGPIGVTILVTLADAILDRLVHQAHILPPKGELMRKTNIKHDANPAT